MNLRLVAVGWLLAAAVACSGGGDGAGSENRGANDSTGATDRAGAPAGGWRIATGGTDGAIGPATTHADLAATFGSIADTLIHMGEGQFEPGTVVHPGAPSERIEVVWSDSSRTRPWRVQVTGDSTVWSVGPGITLGTSLAELETLNGRPLSLTGFGWDYGGTVMGWNQGTLEPALLGGNGRVILRLAVAPEAAASDDARQVSGDGVFPSDDPAMRRLDPRVRQIIVEYD